MTEAIKRGEATLGELAYLTDRVLLAEGKSQHHPGSFAAPVGAPPPEGAP